MKLLVYPYIKSTITLLNDWRYEEEQLNSPFLCNICTGELERVENNLSCRSCGERIAAVEDGITVFNDATDKLHFFEKKVVDVLEDKYASYGREEFLEGLELKDLWEMDEQNKLVGVTRKLWWESHIGRVENKRILEVGCGVTYLIPYWLETGNKLLAFDVCKESVQLARRFCGSLGVPISNGHFACADVTTVQFAEQFDLINVNNVLHHVDDRVEAFRRMGECLSEDGILLLVEPNYYYPPRWIIETDKFDPFNFIKRYFMKNNIVEEDEKGIVFSTFKQELWEAGFKIYINEKDPNYAGYFSVYWLKSGSIFSKAIHYLDRIILQWVLPRLLSPFEYIIAVKR